MLHVLLDYWRRNLTRFFHRNRGAKLLTVAGFFAALAFLVLLVYSLFFYGFTFIAKDTFFGEALTYYITEIFLLVSFLLVLLSALMSGVFSLFRSERNGIVMASPAYRLRIRLVLLRMFLTSLWPLLVIILPALVALRHVFGLPLQGFLAALGSTVFLIALSTLFAIDVLLLVGVFLKHIRSFSLRAVAAVTGVGYFSIIFLVWMQFRSVDLVRFFQARMLDLTVPDLTPIIEQFRFFPSHLSALAVHGALRSELAGVMNGLGGLIVATLFALALFLVLERSHLGLWQKGEEHGHSNTALKTFSLTQGLLSRARSGPDVIFRKEAVAFFRNPKGMMWLGFILFIWAIQVASSHVLVHGLSSERIPTENVPGMIGMLQFASVLYFIAMFVLRFAFPSFSAERKSSWLTAMAPIDLRAVYTAKLLFFSIIFSVFAVAFMLANAFAVGLAVPLSLPIIVLVLLGTYFLTTFGLSLGAIYPNTETDDPERLSTTMPGIGFIFGALAYGGCGAWAIQRFAVMDDPILYVGFILITTILIGFMMYRAQKAIGMRSMA
jgi:hypothetical protein